MTPPQSNRGSISVPAASGSRDIVAENMDMAEFWATSYQPEFTSQRGDLNMLELHENFDIAGEDSFLDKPNDTGQAYAPDASCYLPDTFMEVDYSVEAYAKPSAEVAYRLLPCYLQSVHDWFPILPYGFEEQVERFYNMSEHVPDNWLAMFNLVLAIGARHAALTSRNTFEGNSQLREDVPYISRAIQLLSLKDSTLATSSPNISLVQLYALLSLYYLVAHQAERAWVSIGVALRFGVALNLHLKGTTGSSWPGRTEMLTRTWWSLRSIECLVSSITGRPSAFALQECNVPLPAHQYSIRSISMLQVYIKIGIITQSALSTLYTVRAATLPWKNILEEVVSLQSALEKILPQIADQERLMLHFSWFDSMILITRPCLSPQRNVDHLSPTLRQTSLDMARLCIRAAHGVVKLLPEEPDECIHRNGPWWCLTHYIMRAMAVFLLAMSSQVSIDIDTEFVPSVQKLIRWLRWLRLDDPVAAQGVKVVLNTLRTVTQAAEFASVFEQEAIAAYRTDYLNLTSWSPANFESPQNLSEHQRPDSVLFPSMNLNSGDSQLHLNSPSLPMPPVYGNSFRPIGNVWNC